MSEPARTTRFSICLLLDEDASASVEMIRDSLPESPYRNDIPHVTFVRTIRCPAPLLDADLARDLEKLLDLSETLPLHAFIKKPATAFSPIFRFTSVVLLRASPSMKTYRKKVIKILRDNGYSIDFSERHLYLPHCSVRLGVAYTEHAKKLANNYFSRNSELTFRKWVILSDNHVDGKYLVREIYLGK